MSQRRGIRTILAALLFSATLLFGCDTTSDRTQASAPQAAAPTAESKSDLPPAAPTAALLADMAGSDERAAFYALAQLNERSETNQLSDEERFSVFEAGVRYCDQFRERIYHDHNLRFLRGTSFGGGNVPNTRFQQYITFLMREFQSKRLTDEQVNRLCEATVLLGLSIRPFYGQNEQILVSAFPGYIGPFAGLIDASIVRIEKTPAADWNLKQHGSSRLRTSKRPGLDLPIRPGEMGEFDLTTNRVPSVYDVIITFEVARFAEPRRPRSGVEPIQRFEYVRKYRVEIIAGSAEDHMELICSPEADRQVAACILQPRIFLHDGNRVHVDPGQLRTPVPFPLPIEIEIEGVLGDRTPASFAIFPAWKAGGYIIADGTECYILGDGSSMFTASGEVPLTATVCVRGSSAVALKLMGVFDSIPKVWGGELIFEDVPIERMPSRTETSPNP